MNVDKLLEGWRKQSDNPPGEHRYCLHLPRYDAARLAALAELFPGVSDERILGDLVTAALEQVSGGFKYNQGTQITGHDEQGDPIYADAGLTPRFLALVEQHLNRLEAGGSES